MFLYTGLNRPVFCLPGAQLGLVPTDAGHVLGQQWCRWGAEWNQKPAGKTGVHHETGVEPLRPADRAERTGWLDQSKTLPELQTSLDVSDFIVGKIWRVRDEFF